MPKTVAVKALADGQLANSKGTLYTAPASTQTIARNITLVNTGSGTNTVNLYLQRTGTSRRVISKDTSIAAGEALVVDSIFTLEAADLIEGDASSASEVDYTISGVEIS